IVKLEIGKLKANRNRTGYSSGVLKYTTINGDVIITSSITNNPSSYGLLAMSSVVMNLASIFNDMGTGAAVIQRQEASIGFYNY
ncbi:oligosaccharide flippase family protein, partial [Escherichia coli]|uniref:oligosaccharide flippase family protein n=1 Tax=Escherichia coli TaxID=562 RepID=UPI003EE060E4